jgi:predicted short-subunit dehydrogenase-like oxidoreductase (DUF2520 family)
MTADDGSTRTPARIGIVGRGRVGNALAAGLRSAGHEVDGPAGRGEVPAGEVVLLCVPDSEIEAACATVAGRSAMVGHTSGATPLSALAAAAEHGAAVFGLHPLQTIAAEAAGDGVAAGEAAGDGVAAGDAAAPGAAAALALRGAGCGVAGSSPAAVATARRLAEDLGMRPFELDDDQRAAYHAAASIASNYLLALEATAETVAAGAGIEPAAARELLGPLVRQTVENWLRLGPEEALTGPVARGDEETVARQRAAIEAVAPDALALFDALTERTRELARVPA